ncbi:unnamed protein product [Effrenium voratum]|nr:unnamed protein product [Effrenium voratum]
MQCACKQASSFHRNLQLAMAGEEKDEADGLFGIVASAWSFIRESDADDADTKDFASFSPAAVRKEVPTRRRKRSLVATDYVAAAADVFGHVLAIVVVCWMSSKFSEQHDKIVDEYRHFRYYATLLLLPAVLYTTLKHWSAGKHFPMTGSSSFQVLLRGKFVDCRAPSDLRGADLYCMLANGVFFCYLGLWNFFVLHQRREDRNVFDPSARVLVPLCIACALLRPKSTVLHFSFFGALAVGFVCLLFGSGIVAVVLVLLWIGTFEGRSSKVKLCFSLGKAYDVISFVYRQT